LLKSGNISSSTYTYVDWLNADVAGGTATGTIARPGAPPVGVTFRAVGQDKKPGTLLGGQTAGGTNYWVPSEPYVSSRVRNEPGDSDLVQLAGAPGTVYILSLSEPVDTPIMPIVSLGQRGNLVQYDFDAPFSIISQGVGYWGGSTDALATRSGDILAGEEGHGTIRFAGTVTTISWTINGTEVWHGFTLGLAPSRPNFLAWSFIALGAMLVAMALLELRRPSVRR
jgi:hypothetical protein